MSIENNVTPKGAGTLITSTIGTALNLTTKGKPLTVPDYFGISATSDHVQVEWKSKL